VNFVLHHNRCLFADPDLEREPRSRSLLRALPADSSLELYLRLRLCLLFSIDADLNLDLELLLRRRLSAADPDLLLFLLLLLLRLLLLSLLVLVILLLRLLLLADADLERARALARDFSFSPLCSVISSDFDLLFSFSLLFVFRPVLPLRAASLSLSFLSPSPFRDLLLSLSGSVLLDELLKLRLRFLGFRRGEVERERDLPLEGLRLSVSVSLSYPLDELSLSLLLLLLPLLLLLESSSSSPFVCFCNACCCCKINFGAFFRCSRRSSVNFPRPINVKKLMANLVLRGLSTGNMF